MVPENPLIQAVDGLNNHDTGSNRHSRKACPREGGARGSSLLAAIWIPGLRSASPGMTADP